MARVAWNLAFVAFLVSGVAAQTTFLAPLEDLQVTTLMHDAEGQQTILVGMVQAVPAGKEGGANSTDYFDKPAIVAKAAEARGCSADGWWGEGTCAAGVVPGTSRVPPCSSLSINRIIRHFPLPHRSPVVHPRCRQGWHQAAGLRRKFCSRWVLLPVHSQRNMSRPRLSTHACAGRRLPAHACHPSTCTPLPCRPPVRRLPMVQLVCAAGCARWCSHGSAHLEGRAAICLLCSAHAWARGLGEHCLPLLAGGRPPSTSPPMSASRSCLRSTRPWSAPTTCSPSSLLPKRLA